MVNMENLKFFLLNQHEPSIGFPLFEMRNDIDHYIMIKDGFGGMKHGRLVHKAFKPLSHFAFDLKDTHGQSIPHNCPRSRSFVNIIIKHYGHMTKELRAEKRKKVGHLKDDMEEDAIWMEEDESKLIIKKFTKKIYDKLEVEAKVCETKEKDVNNYSSI